MNKFDIKKLLGENIKKYRKKNGLTQEDLARKINISPKHLSNIEIGQKFVSAELIEKIIENLHIPPSLLFYSPDIKFSNDDSFYKIDRFIDEFTNDFASKIKEKIREEK